MYIKSARFYTGKIKKRFFSLEERYSLLESSAKLKKTYLETADYQLFAFYTVEKWIGICLKGCGCYDFSFECSRVVRTASRLRESLMHEGQPRGIRRRVTASWRACHCLEI